MKIKIGEHEVDVIVTEQSQIVSPHTGINLQKLEIRFTVIGEEANKVIQKSIKSNDEVILIENQGKTEKKWLVQNNSYSYASNREPEEFTHTIELLEKEELFPEALIINTISVRPYRYSENFNSKTLIIDASALIDQNINKSLEQLMREKKYFSVLRKGINDVPIEMRFGQCLWSLHENGVKLKIYLVDKKYDENSPSNHGFLEPDMGNIKRLLVDDKIKLNKLVDILVSKGIIGTDEIKLIEDSTPSERWAISRTFLQVNDIDEY